MANKTRHEFRPTWAAWFWLLVLTIGTFAPYVWWRRRGVRYEVTDSRVIKHTGRLSNATDEFLLDDVTRVRTKQTLGEKLLGGGTITIDTGVDELTISAVPNHTGVVETIRETQAA
ncbi:PH domain-containing protein [Halostella pelagica]|uniref:PH domain-containing protein n=1 Tax=Halostella pelagica TaxID=2583824 RepID=UPI001080F4DB|nr:PH domain-containing protein [Halostella pelagica]